MARGKGKGNAEIVNNPVTGTSANDVLIGSAAMINGGGGNDNITGSDLIERINAGDGDDFIFGGGGDDTIFGNDGIDTAVYTGSLEDAVLTAGKGNSYTLTSADGGTDTLKHVEFIQFDDFTYEVGVNNGVFTRADSASTNEDTAVTIDVLSNDFDFEGDSFSITSFDATSANGATVSLVNGEFVYDSSNAASIQAMGDGDSMTDTFTYTVTDSAGNESTETVSVDVAGASDNSVIDFDSGVNTVNNDYGYYQSGTYQEDGFTLTWQTWDYDYWYYYYGDADPAVTDINNDGNLEFGVDTGSDSGYYAYNYAYGRLNQDNGDTFSITGWDVVNDGGGDSYGYVQFYIYDWNAGDYQYAYTYDDGTDTWYAGGYDDYGNYFWNQTDAETVADTMFNDIAYVDIYAYHDNYWYGSGGGDGIGIDNIEIA